MHVLLVEENSSLRRVIRHVVASLGSSIQECVDSAEAIKAYEANLPDFVIMDIGIKEFDGIALSKQIKAMDPAAKNCPRVRL
jgi:CheY-like chemotaxis protein